MYDLPINIVVFSIAMLLYQRAAFFCALYIYRYLNITRRRMARERRGAGSSLVSMETQFYKQYMKDVL